MTYATVLSPQTTAAVEPEMYSDKVKVIGVAANSRSVMREVRRAGRCLHSVMITGETGTGKTMTARAIHDNSLRAGRLFVSVNCAAIPEQLLESDLFGHVRGAFTGACMTKRGRFEEANGGTLFLDEVAKMSIPMQAKLLTAIETGTIRKIGAERDIQCDVRILAATSGNAQELVKSGVLLEELYYRLSVLEIRTIPLRDRRADIPALVNYYLDELRHDYGLTTPYTVEPAAMNELCEHNWPGNVRQLQNVLARLTAGYDKSLITLEDVCRTLSPATSEEMPLADVIQLPVSLLELRPDESLKGYMKRVRATVIRSVQRSAGGTTKAASRLGLTRVSLLQSLQRARS